MVVSARTCGEQGSASVVWRRASQEHLLYVRRQVGEVAVAGVRLEEELAAVALASGGARGIGAVATRAVVAGLGLACSVCV